MTVVGPAAGTTGGRRLGGIEAARGVAASLVVFYHAARHMDAACHAPLLRRVFQFGHAGVDVFFVLSGFIILLVHAGDVGRPPRLAHYAGRRFTRVLPVYWVALAATLVMAALAGHAWPGFWHVVYSATLLPSWSDPLLGVAWTLQYELVFYLAFAVLILNLYAGLTVFGLWLLAIGVCVAGVVHPRIPPALFSAYNFEFFLGMAAGLMVRRRGVPGWTAWCGGVLLGGCCLLEDLGFLDGYGVPARLAYGVPAALLVAGLAGVPANLRPLAVLGAASYSIYLFQFIWIGAAWRVLRPAPCAVGMPLLVVAAIAGGILMSRWVEYPILRTLRRAGATP